MFSLLLKDLISDFYFTFCRTCFSMGDLGLQVSVRVSVRSPSVRQYLPWVTCGRNSSYGFVPIVLKFCRCFRHGMGMCMWFGYSYYFFFFFFSLFPLCELSHFSTSMYRRWVPCERNSSYNFVPIFLKFCTYFLHGMKMCVWFGYNPCINCCHFFHFVNFVIF